VAEERALWLDGNGVAGLLAEAFGTEMTVAARGCGTCGESAMLGAHRAYLGAGVVLRCPACGDVALCIVSAAAAHTVQVRGTWTFTVPGA
jgi:hypothetical protein